MIVVLYFNELVSKANSNEEIKWKKIRIKYLSLWNIVRVYFWYEKEDHSYSKAH